LYSGQDCTKFKPPLFETVRVMGANVDGSRSTGPFFSGRRHKGPSASRGTRNNKIFPTGYSDRNFRGLKFKVDFLEIWKRDFV